MGEEAKSRLGLWQQLLELPRIGALIRCNAASLGIEVKIHLISTVLVDSNNKMCAKEHLETGINLYRK